MQIECALKVQCERAFNDDALERSPDNQQTPFAIAIIHKLYLSLMTEDMLSDKSLQKSSWLVI